MKATSGKLESQRKRSISDSQQWKIAALLENHAHKDDKAVKVFARICPNAPAGERLKRTAYKALTGERHAEYGAKGPDESTEFWEEYLKLIEQRCEASADCGKLAELRKADSNKGAKRT